jgi:flagellar motor protein MotB
MLAKISLATALGVFVTIPGWSQAPPANDHSTPLYRVTVVGRTVNAVNYQYRSGPTQIDFRGTVLMPDSKGEAIVEAKGGRTEIDAKFEHVAAPDRFGREYLTYTLWAITPDGHAKNLGELLTGSSDKGHLHVTTDLQTFGLIVTAEPYAAVRLPSDVVVMENQVRPDTIGSTEPIRIHYELMPRGAYTYNVPTTGTAPQTGPKVSMAQYEALLELYQAQNAVQIARSEGAAELAPEIFSKAETQLKQAQQMEASKAGRSRVVTLARQASETAEDARALTVQRKHDQELRQARVENQTERQARIEAEAAAKRAQAEAAAAQQTLEAERAARQQAEDRVNAATSAPAPPPPPPPAPAAVVPPPPPPPPSVNNNQSTLRLNLMNQLERGLEVRDTPRGLVVTVPDDEFRGASLNGDVHSRLANVASVLAAYPGLSVDVEGHTDSAGYQSDGIARQRAEAVRIALIDRGLHPDAVHARSMGTSRLVASNATSNGRMQNRRVEIVISGPAVIGSRPTWDHPYALRLP